MATNLPNSNFIVTTTNDTHNFTYTRDKYGFGVGFAIFFFSCLITGVFVGITNLNTGWSGFLIIAAGITFGILSTANTRLRKEGNFTITSQEIIVDGQHYQREHVRRLAVVTPKGHIARSSNVQRGTVIIGGPAIAVGATVVAHQAANAFKEIVEKTIESIGKVNNKVTFQYGNKEVKLAGGMSEKNASYMYDRLVDMMD